MTIDNLREFFGWCSIFSYSLLLIWAGLLIFAKDWLYQLHSRWFQLDRQYFDTIHYCCIAAFKMMAILFNIIPYFALFIMS